MIKKSYLLDTSVILDDVQNIPHLYQNGQNRLFISDTVIEELDKKKDLQNETGYFAREFFRCINSDEPIKIHRKTRKIEGDFFKEVIFSKNPHHIPITLIYRQKYKIAGLDHGLNDAKIAEIANDYGFILLSNDISLKIRSLAKGIAAQSLYRDRVENPNDIDFWHYFNLHKDKDFNSLNANKDFLKLKDWSLIEINEQDNTESSLYFTGKKHFGIKLDGKFEEFKLDEILEESDPYIKPINLEQKMLYAMLIHPKNRVTIATGATGSGKTLIALQAGIYLVKKGIVDGIIYMRNTVTATDKESELGFRKGDEAQKLSYFMYPLYSAINFTIDRLQEQSLAKKIEYRGDVNTIEKRDATEYFLQKHHIEIVDIAHARGITIGKKFVIFDEVQNASNATVKLIGTRIGEKSRVLFLGDWAQIDHPYLTKFRNGAVSLLQKALQDDILAGIQLRQTIRSDIAAYFGEKF
ncbi:phosphate starvation-inducible protein PhoH [Helicobacter sp. 12S02232-10]|uniref:PhoH family protein n=1 Tax=Helicobacter sp. 12S02232-10 TaxID=1476197 RepID=UPI000BA776BC|nr:PhoH family protein [Helicobacter sp. 12S02232-10]PAF47245.1 phosphate starvation-inducible protein PhoH [Helicobacter sp. 12S02232-10]